MRSESVCWLFVSSHKGEEEERKRGFGWRG